MSAPQQAPTPLEEAVTAAWRRGARDWTRRNHPDLYARLESEPSPERDRPILSDTIRTQFEALDAVAMVDEISNRAGGFLDTETPDREAWILRHLEALLDILRVRVSDARADGGGNGLRGMVVHLRDRPPAHRAWHYRDPAGYVIVAAKRAEGSGGAPGPLYYTLVNDRGEVESLLSTLFTRDPCEAATARGAGT